MLYSLDGNEITDKGVGMLADALKVNQLLQNLRSVADSFIIPCMSKVHIIGCQGYTSLDVRGTHHWMSGVQHHWMSGVHIIGCQGYTSLDVRGTHHWMSGVHIIGCQGYTSLDVRGTHHWMSGVHIIGCQGYTSLDVRGTHHWMFFI